MIYEPIELFFHILATFGIAIFGGYIVDAILTSWLKEKQHDDEER